MKTEDLAIKCPECGCVDKKISRKRNPKASEDAFFIPHVPQGDVGVIKCSECGHLFEYCKDHPMPLEVKKKLI
ncbi:MAG: TIGR04165 family Cys-rich peptide [Methanobacteriaceae archaeon]|nr:TIGR04165 family Cys-rich peptide [Methanobacteriaceae archaeon]